VQAEEFFVTPIEVADVDASAAQLLELRDDDPDYPALVIANYMFGGAPLASRTTL